VAKSKSPYAFHDFTCYTNIKSAIEKDALKKNIYGMFEFCAKKICIKRTVKTREKMTEFITTRRNTTKSVTRKIQIPKE
jgi:hypothetical protein